MHTRTRGPRATVLAAATLAFAGCVSIGPAPTKGPAGLLPANPDLVRQVGVDVAGERPWRIVRTEHALFVLTQGTFELGATLIRFDVASGAARRSVHFRFGPGELAYGFGSIWISHGNGEGPLLRLDPETFQIEVSIAPEKTVGPPIVVGFGSIWTANEDRSVPGAGGGSVSRIDASTNRIVTTAPSGPTPLTIAAGEGFLWTANHGNDSVSKIDTRSGREVLQVPASGTHNAVAAGGTVWIAGYHVRKLLAMPVAGDHVTREIALPFAPQALAVIGDDLWVGSAGYGNARDPRGEMVAIDVRTGNIGRAVTVGCAIQAFTVWQQELWAVCDEPSVAVRIRTTP